MILFKSARFAISNSRDDKRLVRRAGTTGLCALESLSPTIGDSVLVVRRSSTSSVPSLCAFGRLRLANEHSIASLSHRVHGRDVSPSGGPAQRVWTSATSLMGDTPFVNDKVDMLVYSYRLGELWAMLVHDSTAPRLAINSQNPLGYKTGMLVVGHHIASEV
jgi:hypothetical protein